MREHCSVRIIAKSTLVDFWSVNSKAKPALERWLKLASEAKWGSMNDINSAVPNAVVLNDQRVKFEIGGGNFRLIVAINFKAQIVFIKFVGTHAQYDKIDALTVSNY